MALTPQELLGGLLREVSRSFYLTLRILPRTIRPQIGMAYLLARAADTLADTRLVNVDKRLEALCALRERILGAGGMALDFGALAEHQGTPGERILLQNIEPAISLLNNLCEPDRRLVRQVLETIVSGQELDLRRFGQVSQGSMESLQTPAELDDYTFRVAGCVGEFWTRLCLSHLFRSDSLDEDRLLSDGIRFGKGLQLVNILRDLPQDLRNGRCYLPQTLLAQYGLGPAELLDPQNESAFRPLYNIHLDMAEDHLAAGWRYTNMLPYREMRVRLACAWPVLIGGGTISLLRQRNVLDASQRVKVSRSTVRTIVFRSVLLYPFPGKWMRQWRTSPPNP